MAQILNYEGKALQERVTFKDTKGNAHNLEAYIPAESLQDAVNLALNLGKPLLLMGEPGCGKTRLAEALAYELHGEKMYEHYFRWDIKSTTKAKDGIYQYDALKRLYHANLKTEDAQKIEDINNYITYGKLADAFNKPQNGDLPNILLIDEVDKADIDFPNDLLLEIDNKRFNIPELGEKGDIEAKSKVIIFITSNQEKELPPAFLRRCLYHFIDFPDRKALKSIVKNYLKIMEDEKINLALSIFEEIRENLSELEKKPSTSELIDWFKMLDFYTALKIVKPNESQRSEIENRLIKQLNLIDKDYPPYLQILLKTKETKEKIENTFIANE